MCPFVDLSEGKLLIWYHQLNSIQLNQHVECRRTMQRQLIVLHLQMALRQIEMLEAPMI